MAFKIKEIATVKIFLYYCLLEKGLKNKKRRANEKKTMRIILYLRRLSWKTKLYIHLTTQNFLRDLFTKRKSSTFADVVIGWFVIEQFFFSDGCVWKFVSKRYFWELFLRDLRSLKRKSGIFAGVVIGMICYQTVFFFIFRYMNWILHYKPFLSDDYGFFSDRRTWKFVAKCYFCRRLLKYSQKRNCSVR